MSESIQNRWVNCRLARKYATQSLRARVMRLSPWRKKKSSGFPAEKVRFLQANRAQHVIQKHGIAVTGGRNKRLKCPQSRKIQHGMGLPRRCCRKAKIRLSVWRLSFFLKA